MNANAAASRLGLVAEYLVAGSSNKSILEGQLVLMIRPPLAVLKWWLLVDSFQAVSNNYNK